MRLVTYLSNRSIGTAGIGKEVLSVLALHKPAHLFFTGRNAKSAEAIISEIKAKAPSVAVTFLKCDLGSTTSVREATQKFLSVAQRLDILIANAGIMAVPPGLTPDGHEIQWGTNFFGHAVLIHLLLPTMLRTAETPGADVRLLLATSQGYRLHPSGGVQFNELHTKQEGINTWMRYGQAKLGAILWARELARRYPQIKVVSVHPGVVRTGLIENISLLNRLIAYNLSYMLGKVITLQQGAFNLIWAATVDVGKLESGAYYEPVGEKVSPNRAGTDDKLAGKLWDWTEKEFEKVGIGASN